MDYFSISQLSRFSGIKPHTIRIWEQRYNALQPNRSKGNTRYYSGSQLRRLLNIVSLLDGPHKVSELCGMPDGKLFSMVNKSLEITTGGSDKSEYYISQLISSGMSFNEIHFEKIFSNCLLKYGMEETYSRIIYPVLLRVGLMWSGDKVPPGNEHFLSNLIKQKFYSAIDALPPAKSSADKWLLFLPEDELHEISLLLADYMIRFYGKYVINLGSNVPFPSLVQAVKTTKPQNLLFFIVHNEVPANLNEYMSTLSDTFRRQNIFVSGNAAIMHKLRPNKKLKWIKGVKELKELLTG